MRAFLVLVAAVAFAQDPEIRLVRIASGLTNPIDIQSSHDGSARLFIVQQNGVIRIQQGGVLIDRPFLDIRARTRGGGECGLLGLAFPRAAGPKRHFYVNYTNPACTLTTVARYRVADDPGLADPASEEVILTQMQPFANHNGGGLAFGPDGFLYIGLGDGGSGGDPRNFAQNNQSWLGKMLRIDTESGGTYRVPASNPFVGQSTHLPEIWATGLRNPWRYSFDRETGDLWIGDVGQGRAEEVNLQRAASNGGENYGWRVMEGLRCFTAGCDPAGFVQPVHEYTREGGDVSVTGGYVYRGVRIGGIRGNYVFADYVTGRIWALRNEGGTWNRRLLLESRVNISSFGQDHEGELYVADHGGGAVARIEAAGGPVITSDSIRNAASFAAGLTPGSLASIFGINLTPVEGITPAPRLPLPTTLAGVSVSVGGRDAPILAVANARGRGQINIQTPWEVTGPNAVVTVTRDGLTSARILAPLVTAQPGVFAAAGLAFLVRDGNQLVTPERPLRRGEAVFLYATGLGPVTNQPATGAASPGEPLARARETVSVTIGGVDCPVSFAGLAPGFAGVYQVNFTAANNAPVGNAELVVRAGAASSPAVTVPVAQ